MSGKIIGHFLIHIIYFKIMKTSSFLRKWNNIIHRDIGYFFFGVTLIYGISGIALNHKVLDNWNAEYIVKYDKFTTNLDLSEETITEDDVLQLLKVFKEEENYKKYYYPEDNRLKIFINSGTLQINTLTGEGEIETLKKRPVFNQVNFLHYNPNKWWTYFSDAYAGALMLLAITGLFVIRGKNGIKWRGIIVATLGLIIPILFLIILR